MALGKTLNGRKRTQCNCDSPPFRAQILNIIALWVLSMIVRSPEMVHELQGTRPDLSEQEIHPALPTPLSKVEPSYREHDLNYRECDAFDFRLLQSPTMITPHPLPLQSTWTCLA